MKNGKEAVRMVSKSVPYYYDAILMDIRMPEMNGIEATKEIRALSRPDVASLPIIAMSADAFPEDDAAAIDAGMNTRITKPINTNLLFTILAQAITERNTKPSESTKT